MNKDTFAKIRSTLERGYLEAASINKAVYLNNNYINVTKTTTDPKTGERFKVNSLYFENTEKKILEKISESPYSDPRIIGEVYNHSKTKKIVLKLGKDYDKDKKKFAYSFEIIDTKSSTIQMIISTQLENESKSENIHGEICVISGLIHNSLIWSEDDSKVMYCAEKLQKEKILLKGTDTKNIKEMSEEYKFKQNWQSRAFDFFNLEIYILDFKKGVLGRVEGIEENLKVLLPQFVNNKHIVFCGIEEKEHNSGLLGCYNKESSIYLIKNYTISEEKTFGLRRKVGVRKESQNKILKISEDPISYYPIPLNEEGKVAYCFSSEWRESHLFAWGLKIYDIKTKKTEILVSDQDQFDIDGKLTDIPFFVFGSFSDVFYFDRKSSNLIIPTIQRSNLVLNFVNILTKKREIFEMKFNFETETVSIHEINENGSIIFSIQNFSNPGKLGKINEYRNCIANKDSLEIIWEEEKNDFNEETFNLDNPKNKLYLVKRERIVEKVEIFDEVYCYIWKINDNSKKDLERPALLMLHGGPHSLKLVDYNPAFNILLNLGFIIVNINYTGTPSYGSQFNENISGRIGEECLREIMVILDKLQEDEKISKDELYYDGGSFSGYLGVLFLREEPFRFKGMSIRNPVVSNLHFAFSSDIPCWAFNECFGTNGKFRIESDYTDEEILKLYKLSPLTGKFNKTCQTEVFLNIGTGDLRVPPRASYFLYKKLKEIGLNVNLRVYQKGNHALGGITETFDYRIQQLVMLLKNKFNK